MSATRPRRSTKIRPRIGSGRPPACPRTAFPERSVWRTFQAGSDPRQVAARIAGGRAGAAGHRAPRAGPLALVAGDGARGARGARGPRRAAGGVAQTADGSPRQLLAGAAARSATGWRMPRRSWRRRADDDPEIALWRAALAAAREDWPAGARELARAWSVLAGYPAALQVRLGLPAAQAASEAGDHGLAGEVLEALAELDLDPLHAPASTSIAAWTSRGRADRSGRRDLARPGETTPTTRPASRPAIPGSDAARGGRLSVEEALAKMVPARAFGAHASGNRMLDGLAGLYRQSSDLPARSVLGTTCSRPRRRWRRSGTSAS